jgi:hypothetical protein
MTELPHRRYAAIVLSICKNKLLSILYRPQHVIYEGWGKSPLFLNPMLPHFAFLLAKKAFRDYETVHELLDAVSHEGERISVLE